MILPDTLFHYYLPDKAPFLNLSDLSAAERAPILADMAARNARGELRRGFPDWYFPQRQAAEAHMLRAMRARGGKPTRSAPHYFSLGRSVGIEWVYRNHFKTLEIPVAKVNTDLYFSLGDTLWTFAESLDPHTTWENEWYQGKLYTYAETLEIIEELGLNLEDGKSLKQHKVFCVEGMIWSDEQIGEFSATVR